ncbi:MAG: cysteine-rich CWC family protein [Gammaproteobacteria bacterium]
MQEKQCSRCGAAFGCGRDDTTCWCVELPLLPGSALDAGADCLCPRCLAAALEASRDTAREAPSDDAVPGDPDSRA